MLIRFIGIAEIAVSLVFIVNVATHTATFIDYGVFLGVTFLFLIALTRHNLNKIEERSEHVRENTRLKYDKEKMAKMRRELEEIDAEEYESHPINVQEYARKLYNEEITLEDIPDTRSKIVRDYQEGRSETTEEN